MPERTDDRAVEHVSKLISSVVDLGKGLPPEKARLALQEGFVGRSIRGFLRENPSVARELFAALPRRHEPSTDLLERNRPEISSLDVTRLFADAAELGVARGIGERSDADASFPKEQLRDLLGDVPGLAEFQRRRPEEQRQDRARRFIENDTLDGLRKAGHQNPREYSEQDRALIARFQRFLSDGASGGNNMYAGKAYQVLVDRIVCVKELPASITSTTEDDVYWRCIAEARYEGGVSHFTYVASGVHTFDSKEFSILLPDHSEVPRSPDLSMYEGADPTEIERGQARLAASSGAGGGDVWLPLVTPPFEGFPMGSNLLNVNLKFRLFRGSESTLTDFLDALSESLGPIVNIGTVIAGLIVANPLIPAAGSAAVAAVGALSKFLKLISGETKLVSFDVSYSAKALKDAFDAQIIPGHGGFPGTRFAPPQVPDGEGVTDLSGPRNVYGAMIHQRFIGTSIGRRTFFGSTRAPDLANVDPDDVSHWYEVILRFERKPAPVQFG